jgi:selenocysteine lyase/cysteine desulfurase
MENYFSKFRKHIIGADATYDTPIGKQKLIYADWIASGRLYRLIEEKIQHIIGPYVGNTHSESSETGTLMTKAYQLAQKIIKDHVNAAKYDVIITSGSGMTYVINKLQRILGLRTCGKLTHNKCIQEEERPVIFITHMEHHSNHTSWYETIADVVVLHPNNDLLIDLDELRKQLRKYRKRKIKIGSFTACSNVTGIETPYHQMAKIMHEFNGLCFIDFAASAPYVDINMHPEDPMEKLDGVMFSPHKFLGGPGTSGVLVFDSRIYDSEVPDNPGGGTVDWTNPWGEYKYIDDIEVREDGGTPGFLQAMRIALCISLKNKMGTENIRKREEEMVNIIFDELRKIRGVHILADNVRHRLGVISFYMTGIHYNLIVKILSDRFGIQVRGGCACAGTYGHYLLHVSHLK